VDVRGTSILTAHVLRCMRLNIREDSQGVSGAVCIATAHTRGLNARTRAMAGTLSAGASPRDYSASCWSGCRRCPGGVGATPLCWRQPRGWETAGMMTAGAAALAPTSVAMASGTRRSPFESLRNHATLRVRSGQVESRYRELAHHRPPPQPAALLVDHPSCRALVGSTLGHGGIRADCKRLHNAQVVPTLSVRRVTSRSTTSHRRRRAPMQTDHGCGRHDLDRLPPVRPHAREQHPEQPIARTEAQSLRGGSLQHGELMP
jgi:hypothetical protein